MAKKKLKGVNTFSSQSYPIEPPKENCNVKESMGCSQKEANVNMTYIMIREELLLIMLLESLPTEYDNFWVAIESRDAIPKLGILKTKLIEEEELTAMVL